MANFEEDDYEDEDFGEPIVDLDNNNKKVVDDAELNEEFPDDDDE